MASSAGSPALQAQGWSCHAGPSAGLLPSSPSLLSSGIPCWGCPSPQTRPAPCDSLRHLTPPCGPSAQRHGCICVRDHVAHSCLSPPVSLLLRDRHHWVCTPPTLRLPGGPGSGARGSLRTTRGWNQLRERGPGRQARGVGCRLYSPLGSAALVCCPVGSPAQPAPHTSFRADGPLGAHPRQSAGLLTQALCLLDGEERKEDAQDFGHSGQRQLSRSACTPVGSGPELRERGGQWGMPGRGAVAKQRERARLAPGTPQRAEGGWRGRAGGGTERNGEADGGRFPGHEKPPEGFRWRSSRGVWFRSHRPGGSDVTRRALSGVPPSSCPFRTYLKGTVPLLMIPVQEGLPPFLTLCLTC